MLFSLKNAELCHKLFGICDNVFQFHNLIFKSGQWKVFDEKEVALNAVIWYLISYQTQRKDTAAEGYWHYHNAKPRGLQEDMWKRIEEILEGFRKEFSHKAAYGWLIVLVIGLMIRTDKLGVTSVIRDLALRPECYESMMRFFRADSWGLSALQGAWLGIVARHAPLWKYQGRVVLIGDGTKQSKEGRKMPGVKRIKQESETQSKASYIYGHFWGCVGILIGTAEKLACSRLHDGLRETADWEGAEETGASHVARLVSEACVRLRFSPARQALSVRGGPPHPQRL